MEEAFLIKMKLFKYELFASNKQDDCINNTKEWYDYAKYETDDVEC